jgi:tyrosine aminotransferase
LILGASHLIQAVVPRLLQPVSDADVKTIDNWKFNLIKTLHQQAQVLYNALSSTHGLSIQTHPMGAMYSMVHINIDLFDDSITSDVDFTRLLLEEENVFVLPGSCFYPQQQCTTTNTDCTLCATNSTKESFFRVVFCAPAELLLEASNRIQTFCLRHHI